MTRHLTHKVDKVVDARGAMAVPIIVSDPPYGTEHAYNALRLAVSIARPVRDGGPADAEELRQHRDDDPRTAQTASGLTRFVRAPSRTSAVPTTMPTT